MKSRGSDGADALVKMTFNSIKPQSYIFKSYQQHHYPEEIEDIGVKMYVSLKKGWTIEVMVVMLRFYLHDLYL